MELVSKRKKRKSRKNLNELGKKCNIILYNRDSCCTKLECNLKKQNNTIKTNCIAGANRLTLGLFHKAVRSETITRETLPEFKQKSILNGNKVMNKKNLMHYKNSCKLHHLSTSNENDLHSLSNNVMNKSKYKIEEMNYSKQNNKESWIIYGNQLSSTPILHDLFKPQIAMTPPIFETSETLQTLSSIESFWDRDGYQLHEEFINSMPKYLAKNIPGLIRHDIMKQTKDFLHDLYIHRYHCETENNISQCIQKYISREKNQSSETSYFSHRTTFEEDSLNYIKMKYTRQRGGVCETVTPPSISTPNSTTTAINISQLSKQYTPEYIYFPHKLNQ